jgi:glycosyltransferase involved in cell wall biosynthesis
MPEKGPDLAIEAVRKADVPLILAGTIDQHLPESVAYFEEKIKPHIDEKQIKYIGPVNMRQKISLLSRARGFLNPIVWEEPFGMVMIEAMALGCPVISFPRGAAPEIVVHRKTGFLVHDVNEMVKFIPRIDGIDRDVAREHVEKNFSARAMAEKYIKVYKKVIRKKKEAAAHRYGEIKTDKPLITPPPVPDFVKKAVSVQVPYRTTQAAMVKVELEPKP